jgi:hypothetical protein
MQPQHDDNNEKDNERPLDRKLHQFVQEALKDFVDKSPPAAKETWDIIISMLNNWIEVDKQGVPCKDTLTHIISNLRAYGRMIIQHWKDSADVYG